MRLKSRQNRPFFGQPLEKRRDHVFVSYTYEGMLNIMREFKSLVPAQRRAFAAAFFGWMLDGFDFTILTFVLADIQRHFSVNSALAGALGTVTLMFRLVGGAAAGTAADRWGRKLPLVLSIMWFSLFTVLSGFSTSYTMLFACRALFGIGMGGEWAAGMPLALEHLPDRLRGAAAGLLQGAWAWGYILSALVFQMLYPVLPPDIAWRVLLWTGAVPAMVVLWIRARVAESPVWLERHGRSTTSSSGMSLGRIFRPDLIGTTIQCSILACWSSAPSWSVWVRMACGERFRRISPNDSRARYEVPAQASVITQAGSWDRSPRLPSAACATAASRCRMPWPWPLRHPASQSPC